MEKFSFSLDGRIFEYDLTIKKIKSVRLKLDDDSNIIVSAPRHATRKFIENFIYQNKDYVDKKIAIKNEINVLHNIKNYKTGEYFLFLDEKKMIASKKYSKNQVFMENDTLYILSVSDDFETRKKLYEKFIKKSAKDVFLKMVDELYPLFSKKISSSPKVTIRFMKTRWGSAKPSDNKITLNAKLMYTNMDLIRMVIVHEFCHFYHLNHSKNFYDKLLSIIPDYRKKFRLYNKKFSHLT